MRRSCRPHGEVTWGRGSCEAIHSEHMFDASSLKERLEAPAGGFGAETAQAALRESDQHVSRADELQVDGSRCFRYLPGNRLMPILDVCCTMLYIIMVFSLKNRCQLPARRC